MYYVNIHISNISYFLKASLVYKASFRKFGKVCKYTYKVYMFKLAFYFSK